MPGDETLAGSLSIERREPTTVAIYPDRERLHFNRASMD
jgi:hypothetical protein